MSAIFFLKLNNYKVLDNRQEIDNVTGANLSEENGRNGDTKFVNSASYNLDIHNESSIAYSLGAHDSSIITNIYDRQEMFQRFGLSKSNITISLINSNGIEIGQVNYLNNGCATIDLSSKPEGIYFLKIIDGENEWIEKLVKVN